ncbi:hypothetical protein GCM10023084_28350 [Streptomyces lacrimifluminis]|uniref:Uncharacterized protein n=1 Tax=Streptomyces lacrimifluminis TaxID=1500077 RepID=A0A917NTM7_9ACTN|nr:hypothetical protein GCM10012282_24970 [Streptomyces lacrimifluminis]
MSFPSWLVAHFLAPRRGARGAPEFAGRAWSGRTGSSEVTYLWEEDAGRPAEEAQWRVPE